MSDPLMDWFRAASAAAAAATTSSSARELTLIYHASFSEYIIYDDALYIALSFIKRDAS